MSLLQQSNAIFYHPCDSVDESLKGIAWTQSNGYFDNAVISSGITVMGGQKVVLSTPSGAYGSAAGANSLTFCFWLTNPENSAVDLGVGWNDSPYSSMVKNGLRLYFSATKISFAPCSNGTNVNFNNVTVARGTGRAFFVCRMEYAAGSVSLDYSVNGSDWIYVNGNVLAAPNTQGDHLSIVYDRGSSDSQVVIDEVACWKDATRFTAPELTSLYEVGAVNGRRLDQYDTLKASGSIDLSTFGLVAISGDTTLVILGPTLSGVLDCTINGVGSLSGSLPLSVCNQLAAGELDLTLWNMQAMGDLPCFMYGVYGNSHPLFLKGLDPYISGSMTLATLGSVPGQTVHQTSAQTTLFIPNGLQPAHRTITFPMLLCGSGSENQGGKTAQWAMFLKGGNVGTASASLFVQGPVPIGGRLGCFVRGAGSDLSAGQTPMSLSGKMFLCGVPGLDTDLPLFISGVIWPSASCDCSIEGFDGVYKAYADTTLFQFGIQGAPSGQMSLFLNVSDVGEISGSAVFYMHGY